MAKKLFGTRDLQVLQLIGERREVIREESDLSSLYDERSQQLKKVKESVQGNKTEKGLIHIFGYKHASALKFYAFLLQCVRSCYEAKSERLCVQLNHMLQLKNDLSMSFMRNWENMASTIRLTIHLYYKEAKGGGLHETTELERLDGILWKARRDQKLEGRQKDGESSDEEDSRKKKERYPKDSFYTVPSQQHDGPAKQLYKPPARKEASSVEKETFSKLVDKLYEFNEKMNKG